MPKQNDQNFYYHNLGGRLLGNKAREELVVNEIKKLESKDFFLEVGCAQGHFEKIASKFSENVFGGEYEFSKLSGAKKNCQECCFTGVNAEKLPFKDKMFDFVLCTEVLEHVPDWQLALKELQRVSRKKILITIPLEKGIFWRSFSKIKGMKTRGHLHKLDSQDVKKRMENTWKLAGYNIIATPSRHLNKHIGTRLGEKAGLYAMLLFEQNTP